MATCLKHNFTQNCSCCNTPDSSSDDISLADMSPKDKKWDDKRAQTDVLAEFLSQFSGDKAECKKAHAELLMAFADSVERWQKYADRMFNCSGVLKFALIVSAATGELALKLRGAFFCHFRHCPTCNWRRQLRLLAQFLNYLPVALKEYPKARWVFMTLTVPNVPIDSLRSDLKAMNVAWKRLAARKEFKSVKGWIRTTEVTRENNREGYVHPHFHCLLMVSPSWFAKDYTKQSRWAEIWGECMRLDITPVVDIRAVKGGVDKAMLETTKAFTYSVKSEEMVQDPSWTLKYMEQVHHLRFFAAGGALKDVTKDMRTGDETNEDLIYTDDNPPPPESEDAAIVAFNWKREVKQFKRFPKGDGKR
ncbi:protein rep [Arsenophonus sp.]|uniref:protein rep n=1 Tax=Arsenophonus sp. TaxID=1872640 RepID=UPI0038796478